MQSAMDLGTSGVWTWELRFGFQCRELSKVLPSTPDTTRWYFNGGWEATVEVIVSVGRRLRDAMTAVQEVGGHAKDSLHLWESGSSRLASLQFDDEVLSVEN